MSSLGHNELSWQHQAITWTIVDQDIQRHVSSLGHNELTKDMWNHEIADLPTPDPAQTIRFMIWNHTISLQTIQFSDQTIQFYSKPYNCLSNHL